MGGWQSIDHVGHGTEVLAVHAALLGDGRVALFSGSEHNWDQHQAGSFDHSRIWDPVTRMVSYIPSPAYDLFCCGHAFLADGRLLVAGGTTAYGPDFRGSREVTILDPALHPNPWRPTAPMAAGRWYPTLVTLPDGRVLTVSGLADEPLQAPVNTGVEVFSPWPAPGGWRMTGHQPDMPRGYPRMHLLPTGSVLCVTPMAGMSRAWDPVSELWADVAPEPSLEYSDTRTTTSVLLPLRPEDGYRARVLVAGAPQPLVLDLDAPEDGWQPTAQRTLAGSPRRNFACAVLLPDGTVLVVGGSRTEQDADAVRAAESFDPATGEWTTRETAAVPRVYHSVALLLRDGTVWTAGSNHNGALGHSEHRIEVYHPPYLDQPGRPQVVAAPTTLCLPSGLATRATFDIETPQAGAITAVALLRCGSVTHAFDADQRYVGLEIIGRDAGGLTVAAPPSAEIAPPGNYFLFALADGVPSLGWPVHVQALTWSDPRAVPGWTGSQTAGADVAVADISGSGRPDLIALHVDDPDLENCGYYRIGWDLDAAGVPAGGWTEALFVPGWFGTKTAEAGVAVADISGSGRPDLVVFHVDNPGGENYGFYRIGWDLTRAGVPAGGWTGPLAVPGGLGGETAGAAVAIGDISGSGRPDLVVVYVDDAEAGNSAYYRIGWDLDTTGVPTRGWSERKEVPGWFGLRSAGGGVALADMSGGGRPDLAVFPVDNPDFDNHGYYRVGWQLDAVGNPTGGWSDPIGVPGWFGWNTSGAGIAVADLSAGGRPDMVVLHVDSPEGENQIYYRVFLR